MKQKHVHKNPALICLNRQEYKQHNCILLQKQLEAERRYCKEYSNEL